jgi:hypothetical protein
LANGTAAIKATVVADGREHSGPSSIPSTSLPSVTVDSANVPTNNSVVPSLSIQQQIQERSRLLVAQEGNAKLEAQVKTLGEEVASKNDVRMLVFPKYIRSTDSHSS